MGGSFRYEFVALFNANYERLFRYLDRLSGDPELAADIAQETFVKLYERGSLPDTPDAWLVTVAMNLLRNTRATRARRRHLLNVVPDARLFGDRAVTPSHAEESPGLRQRVRSALDQMPARERQLLLLRAEGYSYRDIAHTLDINEASVGTLLLRARKLFKDLYEGGPDAPR